MNAPFKSPADPLDAPVWDLSDLYPTRDDARVAAMGRRDLACLIYTSGTGGSPKPGSEAGNASRNGSSSTSNIRCASAVKLR